MRKKKGVLALKPHLPPAEETARYDTSVLDNTVKLLGDFGFGQVVMPALVPAKPFEESRLGEYYDSRLVKFRGELGRDLIFPPTQALSICQLYAQTVAGTETPVVKWFYVAPVAYQAEGAVRTETELGVFILGEDSSLAQAQLANVVNGLVSELGIADYVLEIAPRGCQFCQKDYKETLLDSLGGGRTLCAECQGNLEHDFFAIFDCSKTACQGLFAAGVPQLIDCLDDSCRTHLFEALETIDELGIPYLLSPYLPGFPWQEKILFRLILSAATPRGRVLGQGGNYSRLIPGFAPKGVLPSVGFMVHLEELDREVPEEKRRSLPKAEVFLVPLGPMAARSVLVLEHELRRAGVRTREAMLDNPSIKYQVKQAASSGAEMALIIGQREALDGTVILRDIRSNMQELFARDRIAEEVKKRLGK